MEAASTVSWLSDTVDNKAEDINMAEAAAGGKGPSWAFNQREDIVQRSRTPIVDSGGTVEDKPPPAMEKAVFMDAQAMKDKIRAEMIKPSYDVTEFYYTEGIWQLIARDGNFEKITLGVIAFNALWISIDTDGNSASTLLEAMPQFQIAEQMFCVYFSFEWFVRFKSFKRKRNGLKDAWFVFDSSLVFMMVAETWVMSVFLLISGAGSGGLGNASILRMARLLRLSRMARMARLFRAMPELLIMIKGIAAAMRSVLFTLVLLFILIYVFSIAFVQLTADIPEGEPLNLLFGNVPRAMHSLLIHGTILDGPGAVVVELGNNSYVLAFVFYIFILLAAFTILNMLIGVLCEVVSGVAAVEREKLTVAFVKFQLEKVMQQLDKSGDGEISKVEFSQILDNATATKALEEVGVDVVGLIDNIDFIFQGDDDEGEKNLDFASFIELVLELRGDNMATVKDIVDLRKFIGNANKKLKEEIRGKKRTSAPLLTDVSGDLHEVGVQPKARPHSAPACKFTRCDDAEVKDNEDLWDQRRSLLEALSSVRMKLIKFSENLAPNDSWIGLGCYGGQGSKLSLSSWDLPGSVWSTEPQEEPQVQDQDPPSLPVGAFGQLHGQLMQMQDGLNIGIDALQEAREWIHLTPVAADTRSTGKMVRNENVVNTMWASSPQDGEGGSIAAVWHGGGGGCIAGEGAGSSI
eukprot:CAMPEP_0204181354 /NCGR_PEP_ID=MMETSP0361-20130328/51827_1 /ASSEMBLY_ACC=CAM_ASM_000343 /TAXON_ID=268821 /ORGANISM="Scrippsiella Hangoei, Strain SHTV-5" /LENGTH=690 /DNA_ID=CAMNT_0051140921 /DNA_START=141 /DNA_END=2210 /DNA_ORIENTATION=-